MCSVRILNFKNTFSSDYVYRRVGLFFGGTGGFIFNFFEFVENEIVKLGVDFISEMFNVIIVELVKFL